MTLGLAEFDMVRIINLADRKDRRRVMSAELTRVGMIEDARVAFFDAVRPLDAGNFPSVGSRGCFMSHLEILRAGLNAGVRSLLILEDDLNFVVDYTQRSQVWADLFTRDDWHIFYGAYRIANNLTLEPRRPLPAGLAIETTAFVAFNHAVLARLVEFLEAMLDRPAGSPDYGPMHVDGAYSVFRHLNPDVLTFAASPKLGYQRASRSDIADPLLVDRYRGLRDLANIARRVRSAIYGRSEDA